MRAFLACLTLSSTLIGCAADPEFERVVARYGEWCERFGGLSGTKAYGECLMNQQIQEEQMQKARRRP
jgi:hypothetical protein